VENQSAAPAEEGKSRSAEGASRSVNGTGSIPSLPALLDDKEVTFSVSIELGGGRQVIRFADRKQRYLFLGPILSFFGVLLLDLTVVLSWADVSPLLLVLAHLLFLALAVSGPAVAISRYRTAVRLLRD
jgi:hypothetical protein